MNTELMLFKSGDIALTVPITPDRETVWLTQDQMSELFDTARSSIAYHIGRIFSEGELNRDTSVEIFDRSSGNASSCGNKRCILWIKTAVAVFQPSCCCKTPHVTEEEVKAAFVLVVNKLIGNRATLLADLREIQQTYSGTDDLNQSLHELDDRLNAEAEAVQRLIAQNARVALNQDDYNVAYDAAVSRYEAAKAEREKVAADIRQRGIRRREFERFITELEKLPEAVSEFDETLWGSLVDYVTVGKDKTMVFTLIGGTETTA